MTAPQFVRVAGMDVPLQLVPRIVSAFRGTYPSVTGDLGDDAAVRAVLRYLVESIVVDYEGKLAGGGVEEAVSKLREDYQEQARVAREQARAAARLFKDAPDTTTGGTA